MNRDCVKRVQVEEDKQALEEEENPHVIIKREPLRKWKGQSPGVKDQGEG